MPNKTQEYINLAQQTAKELTRYWENWTDYLTTASRLYKYSYPHALRCLPLQLCRIQGVQNRHCSQRRP